MIGNRNLDQEFRIKRALAETGDTMSSLARKINEPFGSVASNIYGYRSNPPLQEKIAQFLGRPVAEIFGDNHERAA